MPHCHDRHTWDYEYGNLTKRRTKLAGQPLGLEESNTRTKTKAKSKLRSKFGSKFGSKWQKQQNLFPHCKTRRRDKQDTQRRSVGNLKKLFKQNTSSISDTSLPTNTLRGNNNVEASNTIREPHTVTTAPTATEDDKVVDNPVEMQEYLQGLKAPEEWLGSPQQEFSDHPGHDIWEWDDEVRRWHRMGGERKESDYFPQEMVWRPCGGSK
ncbi:hypothetical protein B0I35DRAFT_429857 [Stachybotrys elegans]|uniref:Uncharacterized protein n=1 Tax=Stachybotrys elegans TaxID=80388 RepID=A0A8K0WRA8_9HYPO|nr:hypothetical protein B0I35DRAFT_429857 [Stachybotrys elegans]